MGDIDSSCKIEQKNKHTLSDLLSKIMNFFENFMTKVSRSKRHIDQVNTNQVKGYVQQFFQEEYAKEFKNMNPHAQRVIAEAISKMSKEEKEMQLHAINKMIEENPDDCIELKALKKQVVQEIWMKSLSY